MTTELNLVPYIIHHRYYAKCLIILAREVRKDVHFVQSDLRDLLLRRSPACPGYDEVSLVKRGWECPAQMSKFYKILLFIDWEYIFQILF